MNRQNLFKHLMLAFAIILVAAFAGQIRRARRTGVVDVTPSTTVATDDDADDDDANAAATDFEPSGDAEVIVRFRAGTSAEEINRIAARLHDRVEDRFEYVDGEAVIADQDDEDAEAVAAEYRALPEVVYAEPNVEISLDPNEDEDDTSEEADAQSGDDPVVARPAPNDPLFEEQWSLLNTGQQGGKSGADISAVRAWEKTTGSEKIVVAVIDTGVDYTHADLSHNIWTRPANLAPYTDGQLGTFDDLHGFDAADMDGDPMDDNGHGTHCAGIVGAEGDNQDGIAGVNWHVQIMPLKFLNAQGSGSLKDAIECINYVIARKRDGVNVRIISASWGSTFYSRALEDAIRRAGEEGILFVAAAGNASTNNDRRPHYPSSYDLANVVSVAALTRQDNLARFSNYGARSVHIAAPGAEILSTWPGNEYEEHSGTSMATPEVSGVAALVLAVNPNLTMKELRARILESVDKLPALDGKVSTGGRLNAARAVRAE
ncbi:MAG: S8 family serine peptidase [Acidobacteria bacterium]|nr:S8 family serine peptidase [Acidobacteriota bacterium]